MGEYVEAIVQVWPDPVCASSPQEKHSYLSPESSFYPAKTLLWLHISGLYLRVQSSAWHKRPWNSKSTPIFRALPTLLYLYFLCSSHMKIVYLDFVSTGTCTNLRSHHSCLITSKTWKNWKLLFLEPSENWGCRANCNAERWNRFIQRKTARILTSGAENHWIH